MFSEIVRLVSNSSTQAMNNITLVQVLNYFYSFKSRFYVITNIFHPQKKIKIKIKMKTLKSKGGDKG